MSPDPIRILMLAPTPFFSDRGCHVRIYEEARILIAMGCDVRIVTYHIGRDMPGIPAERIVSLTWYRKVTAGPSWQKPLLDILLFLKASSVALDFRPQIIHAHLHEGAFIGMLLRPLLRAPLIMDFQGSLTTECLDHNFFKAGSLTNKVFAFLEKIINSAADAIITSSTTGADQLRESGTVAGQKLHPVIDGVDTACFFPCPANGIRERYGIPEHKPLVVFLGVLNEYQGVDHLLQAALILKEKKVDIHFLLMGYPETAYRSKAVDLGLAEMITFTGRVDYTQAASFLGAGDIAVSPKLSRTEANGKILNYMACALPTVVFETEVNRELLGDTGVYAAYGDAADLAQKMADLLADPGRLQALSRMVREKAEREHSWSARGSVIMNVYRQLLDNNYQIRLERNNEV